MRALQLLLVLGALVGCAPPALIRAAQSGDLDAFRTQLGERLRVDGVSAAEAERVAVAFARGSVERAAGRDGERFLAALASCAPLLGRDEIALALERRAALADELAARAALVRVAAGLAAPLAYAAQVTSAEPAWRAAAARSLAVAPVDAEGERAGAWRRRLLLDLFRDVREAAAQAASAPRDPADRGPLFDAARRDPDTQVRRAAIAALGAAGGRDVVLSLKDLWPGATAQGRQAILGAWAAPACVEAGGIGQLRRVVEQEGSGLAVVAARQLLAVPAGSADQEAAVGVLLRAVAEGTTAARTAAIAAVPLGGAEIAKALDKAAEAPDELVAVAALSRLTELAPSRDRALARLSELARRDGAVGRRARAALVRAGAQAVLPLLEADVRSPSHIERADAARAYARLGQPGRALHLLGDADASVRLAAACALAEDE
ncbi:MAG: hypothetical protein HY744_18650 [Deltaproteobacteria bacterium]|nr:hypothetical protein [Deltaproteobacteria bacterium]